jgi:hypothetical protein
VRSDRGFAERRWQVDAYGPAVGQMQCVDERVDAGRVGPHPEQLTGVLVVAAVGVETEQYAALLVPHRLPPAAAHDFLGLDRYHTLVLDIQSM